MNLLDSNMNFSTDKFKPYHKPNEDTSYIDIGFNHSLSNIKQLVNSIIRHVSNLSADKVTFKKAIHAKTP